MIERPILFTAEMVCAILDGRKTQTRRIHNKHVEVGNRLWVRETWGALYQEGGLILMSADVSKENRTQERCEGLFYKATDNDPDYAGCWLPSIFMPRWASRITLEIINVRREQLQDITPVDCKHEGILIPEPINPTIDDAIKYLSAYKSAFQTLWDSINAKRGYPWHSNPTVWVYNFKRLDTTP